MKFKDLDVENWDVSSATDMSYMFYGCGELTELDLSKWDVSNVTTMYHMFTDCIKMERYNFSGWDTSKVTVVNGMFNSNRALKTIDLSDFDTQNIQDFSQLFDGASALETVIGMDKWDTSSGLYYVELFTGTKVKEVDLSSFDMTTALRTDTMFSGNSELTTIYVGDNWNLDPARLEKSGGMFGGNPKLTGANGTTTAGNPTDATYARVDTPAVVDAEGNVITEAVPGYLTYKAAPEAP
jgi:surface protein